MSRLQIPPDTNPCYNKWMFSSNNIAVCVFPVQSLQHVSVSTRSGPGQRFRSLSPCVVSRTVFHALCSRCIYAASIDPFQRHNDALWLELATPQARPVGPIGRRWVCGDGGGGGGGGGCSR